MVESDNIHYEEKIVAFLDILGFRRLVFENQDRAMKVISELDKSLSHSLECLELEDWPDFSAKLFSDCFCLSCKSGYLECLLRELSYIQWFLASNGIFLKGAIADGRHFENERMIFSEGLVNAYELQNQTEYPRILIKDTIVERMKTETFMNWGNNRPAQYLIMAPDSVYFLDYLQGIEGFDTGTLKEELELHKNAVLEQVSSNIENHKVLKKYKWVAEYHNFKFNDFFNIEDWEENYVEELKQKLLIPMNVFPSFKTADTGFSKLSKK